MRDVKYRDCVVVINVPPHIDTDIVLHRMFKIIKGYYCPDAYQFFSRKNLENFTKHLVKKCIYGLTMANTDVFEFWKFYGLNERTRPIICEITITQQH